MVWHVHKKGDKFAVWSTIVDDYVTYWGDEDEIMYAYIDGAVRDAVKSARANIERAKEHRCSAMLSFRCDSIPRGSTPTKKGGS